VTRWIAVLLGAVALIGTRPAYAQDSVPGPGAVVITIIPAGATFFREAPDTNGPSFRNYDVGAGVDFHFNRYVGVEAEVTGAIGIAQDLQFSGETFNLKTPHLLNYSGNFVLFAPNRTSVLPYVTGGAGGLTVFDKASLGINETQTFLTGNVGGGAEWFHGRWGLRGDYRFTAVASKDHPAPATAPGRVRAPSFFGSETRYGHRVCGGFLINVRR
jgi:Outer membrane protein beta-barrel domain